jgi:hypothetical protein
MNQKQAKSLRKKVEQFARQNNLPYSKRVFRQAKKDYLSTPRKLR